MPGRERRPYDKRIKTQKAAALRDYAGFRTLFPR